MTLFFRKIDFFFILKKILTVPLYVLLCIEIVCACYFFLFDARQSDHKTDAIVVFTGGQNRVATGIDLFEKKMGTFLYISGLNPETTLNSIFKKLGKLDLNTENIYYDFAKNTEENAKQTANWIRLKGVHSIRLVTERLHMKRALFLLSKEIPDLSITPHPIALPSNVNKNTIDAVIFSLQEFLKFQFEVLNGC
ncbi:MAG: hypothetical protein HEEMFOPI_01123 [Holosporales bacterium]